MPAKLITPTAILSFPHFDEPQPSMDGQGKDKYSAALIFTSERDITALQEAVVEVAVAKWGQGAIAKLKAGTLWNPLKTGAEATAKGYPEGSTYTNARSEQRPGLVYPWPEPGTAKPMIVPEAKIKEVFYPGALVRASVTAFTFDKKGKKGVSFGLNNVQLVDGSTPRMDGRKLAQEEFDVAEGAMAPADMSDVE